MNEQIGTIKEVRTVLSSVMMNSTRTIGNKAGRNASRLRAIAWSDDAARDITFQRPARDFGVELFAVLAWLSASACAATALLLFF